MRSLRVWLVAALLLVFCRAGTSAAADEGGNKVEQVVSGALAEFAIPGAAVAASGLDGSWVRTFGLADVAANRPVRPNDYFAIRSITKSFVVTAVLQLVANSDGAVRLDDPIGKFLQDVPNGDVVTIRQLGNMTSGLFNYTSDEDLKAAFGADPTRAWTADELLAFAFNSASHGPIVFPAGTRYQYSNTNTLLLGKLVETLTGQPFADVLQAEILAPSGLRSTRYLSGVRLPRPSVKGYQGTDDDGAPDAVAINATSLNFAGAMAATVSDLARWGTVLATGTLLPAELQKQRFRARSAATDPNSPLYDRYGLGMGEVAGWWGHTGEGVGFEAAVFHQIEQNRTFAIVLNASNVSDVPVVIFCRVLRAVGQLPASAPESRPSICATDPASRSGAGLE